MPDEITQRKIEKVCGFLFRKLGRFFSLRPEMEEAISAQCKDEVTYPPRATIIRQADPYDRILLLEKGWVLRSKSLADGRRQIVNVALPGDFLCFNATLFKHSDYDLVAKTQVKAFRLKRLDLEQLMHGFAPLAVALAWTNAHEEALLSERIVSLGRRDARERMAHVLCEISSRTRILGLNEANTISIPLTQEDFADVLGVSTIHVNRTLRALARQELISYGAGEVRILQPAPLARLAGFEDDYLHFTERNDYF